MWKLHDNHKMNNINIERILTGENKMATVGEALSALGITEWVLRGEPTTEEEFNEMFKKVTGATADGTAIESFKHF